MKMQKSRGQGSCQEVGGKRIGCVKRIEDIMKMQKSRGGGTVRRGGSGWLCTKI